MKELQRRQKIRKILYSWPSLILVAIATFFLVKGSWLIMKVERDSAYRVSNLEAQASELSNRESKLQADINNLRTTEGIEEEIKQKFSVTRDGEHVAIIVNSRNNTNSSSTDNQIWIKRLWSAIMQKL